MNEHAKKQYLQLAGYNEARGCGSSFDPLRSTLKLSNSRYFTGPRYGRYNAMKKSFIIFVCKDV